MSSKSPDNAFDLSRKVNDAITRGDITELLALLESQKVDVDARDESHDLTTVLMKVCYMNIENEAQFAILDILEDLEVATDVRDASGRTAVMHSCIAEKTNIFNFLLSLRCDMNVVDSSGNSVLAYAIKSGNVTMLESVLEHDSAVELIKKKNNIGQVPLDIARQTNNAKVTNIVEGFQQSVFESEKLLKRKRSKRRALKLPPTSYSTASKPQGSNAVSKPQGSNAVSRPQMVPVTNASQNNIESITTPRVANSTTRTAKATPRLQNPTPRAPITTPRVPAITPRVPAINPRLLANRDRYELEAYHVGSSNKEMFKETSSCDSAIESMPQSPQYETWQRCSECTPRDNDVTPRAADVTSNYANGKQSHSFPQIKIPTQKLKKEDRKCRRNSVSLPDLRDLQRNLVSSGDVTPASADGLCNHPFSKQSKESLAGSDEVFLAPGKENRRDSVLTDLPKLSDISKHKKSNDFRKVGKSKTRYTSDEALYRSLIS